MFRTPTLLALFVLVAPAAAEEPARKPVKPTVAVEVRGWDEVTKFATTTKGRVVVVDVWSTWCDTCLRELPHFVKLAKAHPKRVAGISVSLDFDGAKGSTPEELKPQVLTVLKKLDADVTRNVVCRDADETVYERLELGAIPLVLVYANGKLVKRFDNDYALYGDDGFTYEKHITPLVEKLLAKPAE